MTYLYFYWGPILLVRGGGDEAEQEDEWDVYYSMHRMDGEKPKGASSWAEQVILPVGDAPTLSTCGYDIIQRGRKRDRGERGAWNRPTVETEDQLG